MESRLLYLIILLPIISIILAIFSLELYGRVSDDKQTPPVDTMYAFTILFLSVSVIILLYPLYRIVTMINELYNKKQNTVIF